ncbi:hypothetical protein J812_4224, partial [Acinetobacter baumannii 25977_9]
MLKTIVEFKFDDYQLYDQNLSAEDGNTLVQKTEDIAQYIYSILKNRYHLSIELNAERWGWEIEVP